MINELNRRLAERDAVIDQLLKRVDALERQVGGTAASPPSGNASRASRSGAKSTAERAVPTPPSTTSLDAVIAGQVSPAPSPAEEPAPEIGEGTGAAELTLVEQGALLLPPWTVEVEPEFRYEFEGSDALRIIDLVGVPTVVQRDVRRDTFEGRLSARLGLPHGFQADIRVPFLHARERTVLGGEASVEEETGLGDIEIGLLKQLVEQRGIFPGFIGGIRWKSSSGDANLAGVSLGTGTDAVQASLTAVSRLDPLVLFGTLSYTHQFDASISDRRVDRGDLVGVKLGAVLAASPEASITMAFDTVFSQETEVDGSPVLGSDDVSSVLELGVGVLVSQRTLLSVTGALGITESAPDLRLGVALPTRF